MILSEAVLFQNQRGLDQPLTGDALGISLETSQERGKENTRQDQFLWTSFAAHCKAELCRTIHPCQQGQSKGRAALIHSLEESHFVLFQSAGDPQNIQSKHS